MKYGSSEEYRQTKVAKLAGWRERADRPHDTAADGSYQREREVKSWSGEDFYYLPGAPSPGLMGIWTEVGLEPFSYYLYDCEEVIVEQLDATRSPPSAGPRGCLPTIPSSVSSSARTSPSRTGR